LIYVCINGDNMGENGPATPPRRRAAGTGGGRESSRTDGSPGEAEAATADELPTMGLIMR